MHRDPDASWRKLCRCWAALLKTYVDTGLDRQRQGSFGAEQFYLHSTRSTFYYVRVAVLGRLDRGLEDVWMVVCIAPHFVGSGKLPSACTAVGLRSLARAT